MSEIRRDAQDDLVIASHKDPAKADEFYIEVNERERSFRVEGWSADQDSAPSANISRDQMEDVFLWLAEKLYGKDYVVNIEVERP